VVRQFKDGRTSVESDECPKEALHKQEPTDD
jgi:hypothetical protein